MDKNRLWLIGSVLVMVFVLVGGVFLGIQPQLAAAATANEQRVSVEASNAGQAAVLDQLKKDFDDIGTLKAELAPLSASVPSGTMMPAFVKQLDTLAGSTQVTLDGFTVSDATPYAPVEAPAAVVDSEAGSTATPTPAPAPIDAATVPTAGVPPVTSAQITAENFASLAVTVTVSGGYANALSFVNGLQTGERLFLVSGLTTTTKAPAVGEASSGLVTAVISGLVYVLVPAADAAVAPAAG
ncbi:hypothetical protein E3T61_16360 [Cryobacterium lactosi]|uniref:Pilus assembly protein PilO n=1 Tax=Cryobacterium lactosi TaxID=1259202 RepID=A0A4R9BL72_9MICO|nr:hypothetical protein [Cryobacterium lactosi]TFD86478.1 hypothetical protein E3T61_16360 [Cryobacterium lactosi]